MRLVSNVVLKVGQEAGQGGAKFGLQKNTIDVEKVRHGHIPRFLRPKVGAAERFGGVYKWKQQEQSQSNHIL